MSESKEMRAVLKAYGIKPKGEEEKPRKNYGARMRALMNVDSGSGKKNHGLAMRAKLGIK